MTTPAHLFAPLLRRAAENPADAFCHILRKGVWETTSNGDIVAASWQFAARLRAAGVAPGQIVPIALEHRRALYASFIGASLAGAVPAFLPPLTAKQDPEVFAKALAAQLARIRPTCVIASRTTMPKLAAGDYAIIDVDAPSEGEAVVPGLPAGAPVVALGGMAFLQHSSGTTGLKKGVALSHAAVSRQIACYARAIGLSGRDIVASWLPLYHDMGLITSFLLPAVCGVPIVSLDALEWTMRPTLLLDAVARFGATLCWMPNFAFHHIVRLAPPGKHWALGSLRLVINCSEPCRAAAFDRFTARFAEDGLAAGALQTSYALAENVFAVSQTAPGVKVRRHGGLLSSGLVLANARVRIEREDGGVAPAGDEGEILIASDCLFDGYYRQPELSAERLRDGWYRSGDIGFIEAGELFVIGRRDDVLNVNGRKIFAHEVEHDLNGILGVAPGRVLVYAAHDEAAGATQLMVAAERAEVVTDEVMVVAAIRRAVVNNCGLHPARVRLLDRGVLLKSTSGKISRVASISRLSGVE